MKQSTVNDVLVTIDQAAELFRTSRRTIEQWAADGKIPRVARGRFRLRDLHDYFVALRVADPQIHGHAKLSKTILEAEKLTAEIERARLDNIARKREIVQSLTPTDKETVSLLRRAVERVVQRGASKLSQALLPVFASLKGVAGEKLTAKDIDDLAWNFSSALFHDLIRYMFPDGDLRRYMESELWKDLCGSEGDQTVREFGQHDGKVFWMPSMEVNRKLVPGMWWVCRHAPAGAKSADGFDAPRYRWEPAEDIPPPSSSILDTLLKFIDTNKGENENETR